MYTKTCILIITGCFISIATNAFSAQQKINYMECRPKQLLLCEAEKNKCENIPVVNADGEYIVKINFQKKMTETFEGNKKVAGSKIDRIEYDDELIFLTGYREQHDGKRLLRNWNAVIDTQSGRLTFTSVANGIGFMLSGLCADGKG